MKTLIVVPARYGSTRFPGKPLALINGVSMIRRTARIAELAATQLNDASYVVATDNAEIKAHCESHDIPVVMTAENLPTGSDRALAAAKAVGERASHIVNLQGDAPFTPISHIVRAAQALGGGADVATPYIQLSWDALDALREHKKTTPFSGTTLIADETGKAVWFSKNIIPAIRNEAALKTQSALSPICRHVGLYAYQRRALEQFVSWPESRFERLEGLEQLRLLENGLSIECVKVDPPDVATPGIDTPEDVALAERMIAKYGDPFS